MDFVLAILFIGSYEKYHDKEFSKFVEESCRKIKISLNHMDQVKSLVLGYLGLASSFEETADILFFVEKCEKKKRTKNFFE